PAAPGAAQRRRVEHRRLAAGLQRHGSDVRQRDPVGADQHLRRHLQLRPQAVLRDRRGRARSAAGSVLGPVQLSARRVIALVAALVVFATLPAAAQAKTYALPDANIAVRIQPNGALLVTEKITFLYDGAFSGAYRDIPLRNGESIDRIVVSEGGQR